jgi:very-short-patch-repair endonuclease
MAKEKNYDEYLKGLEANAENARFVLQDLDAMLHLVPRIAQRMVSDELDLTDPVRIFMLDHASKLIEENFRTIHEYAESPIEIIFLCSLCMNFVMYHPMSVMFTPPINVEEYSRSFNEDRNAALKSWQTFQDVTGSHSIPDFIEDFKQMPGVDDEVVARIMRYLVLYKVFDLYEGYHFTLQPQIDNVRVKGKKIRPDLYIWLPSDPTFKIVVECDGFAYHSNKTAFSNDRTRDRTLQQKGFQVFRFSGHEIYRNPVGKSAELFLYLMRLKGENI